MGREIQYRQVALKTDFSHAQMGLHKFLRYTMYVCTYEKQNVMKCKMLLMLPFWTVYLGIYVCTASLLSENHVKTVNQRLYEKS
jgi:hypothetical protein